MGGPKAQAVPELKMTGKHKRRREPVFQTVWLHRFVSNLFEMNNIFPTRRVKLDNERFVTGSLRENGLYGLGGRLPKTDSPSEFYRPTNFYSAKITYGPKKLSERS